MANQRYVSISNSILRFIHAHELVGLDPHRNTPVEILHVILLGFVKYLWQDVVARLSPEQKTTLAIRISAFDVSGLGLSPLPGFMLVQYASSLVGRDFRAIAQVAPHVLKDLVPKECFVAWLSLSSLIPLVWQPKITQVESHLVRPITRSVTFILTICYLFLGIADQDEGGDRPLPHLHRPMDSTLVQQAEVSHNFSSPRTRARLWSSNALCNRGL